MQEVPKLKITGDSYHPLVEVSIVTDTSDLNFGRTRIDSPQAAEVATYAAELGNKSPKYRKWAGADMAMGKAIEHVQFKLSAGEISRKRARGFSILRLFSKQAAMTDADHNSARNDGHMAKDSLNKFLEKVEISKGDKRIT